MEAAKGFIATAIISAPSASAAGSAVVVAAACTVAAPTNGSTPVANSAHLTNSATPTVVLCNQVTKQHDQGATIQLVYAGGLRKKITRKLETVGR